MKILPFVLQRVSLIMSKLVNQSAEEDIWA
jgi:hypothetical protein